MVIMLIDFRIPISSVSRVSWKEEDNRMVGFQVESDLPLTARERLRIAFEIFELDAWSGEDHGRANTMALYFQVPP